MWIADDIGMLDKRTREHTRAYDQFAPLFAEHRISCQKTSDMEYADFFFIGHGPRGRDTLSVGVERKTTKDLLKSLRNGRLSTHQIPGMLETYDIAWLVVEGNHRADPASGVLQEWSNPLRKWIDLRLGSSAFMHSEIERFLLSVSVMTAYELGKPLHVYQTRNRSETARMIANHYVLVTAKEWGEHRSHLGIQVPEIREPVLLRPKTREEEVLTVRRRIAMCLGCGIGQEKSIGVAGHFRSHRAMLNATERELREIDGIGKEIARQFVEEVTYGE